ncbi:unnamed protein product, partial [Phaeothamnion confervicola]
MVWRVLQSAYVRLLQTIEKVVSTPISDGSVRAGGRRERSHRLRSCWDAADGAE